MNNQSQDCIVYLGLGELRYNLLFSFTRWTSVAVCLPSGFLIDRLGNGRSAIVFSSVVLLGAVLFAVGATSIAPVSTPLYILMLIGYGLLAFGDGPLRVVQARVVAHCFPEATFIALAFSSFGYCGQGLSLYVTPIIGTVFGLKAAVWLGPVSCGVGVLCAVALVFLFRLQEPAVIGENENKKILTFRELRALPGSYWLSILSLGFCAVGWLVKQANLPDYLTLRHGYTMTEASHTTSIGPTIVLLSPFVCLLLNKIDCDGIVSTIFQAWLVFFYVILAFAPAVNMFIVALADGIGIGILTAMTWQLLVVLSPASYVGTLGGVMYSVRNTLTALTFIAAGYILQWHKVTDKEEALYRYQHLFITLITLSSLGVVFGVIMNVVDFRKDVALNSRISRWQKSNMESIGLISMAEPSSKYFGINDAKESGDTSINTIDKQN